MKKYLFYLLLACNSFIYAQDTLEFTDLYGDYLGQTPPGDTPVVFARGYVSTDLLEHSYPSFSPDGNEVFWQVNRRDGEEQLCSTMTMECIEGRWTTPKVAPYGGAPVFSIDGERLYFQLSKPACDGKGI